MRPLLTAKITAKVVSMLLPRKQLAAGEVENNQNFKKIPLLALIGVQQLALNRK
jgi:hypothetical protein